MFEIHKETLDWGGRPLVLETGKIARQALGSVCATYGETMVLAAVTTDAEPREGVDFLPLAVHYMERTYSAGRIPGGYFRREGRPTERETLVSRLIDRPIRPLFAKTWRRETQLILTVLSHDMENDPDIVAMIAGSAALAVSGLPFAGPVGAARVSYQNGDYLLNPSPEQRQGLDLVAAGTKDAVLMVESEASELSEEVMLGAVFFAQQASLPVIAAIESLAQKVGKPKIAAPEASAPADLSQHESGFADAYAIPVKTERQEKLAALRSQIASEAGDNASAALDAAKKLESKLVRQAILDGKPRIDGRSKTDIRPIVVEAGVLPRAHGSALFTRGETQSLASATLGTGNDEQMVDALEGMYRERFMLHYNFPPYSVGETGRVGFTGRREVGHGKLAWRALHAVLPSHEDFPYTLRCVSEITESNGSSSMATVCSCSLALMDAGVPVQAPVAGIAMGLIKEGEQHAILSDILGDEDHLGDMDFKVAGTEKGITALQMDIKITGITRPIMEEALAQAKQGRAHILGEMVSALDAPRASVGQYAPRIEVLRVPVDKIRDIIGPGGRIIREIVETTGAKVDIEDDGVVKIAASDEAVIEAARARIHEITAEPEVGELYDGTVVKITDFGAFVNFFGKRDGLVHISQIAPHRIERVSDVLQEGGKVRVKLVGFDDRGRVRLTMRDVPQPDSVRL